MGEVISNPVAGLLHKRSSKLNFIILPPLAPKLKQSRDSEKAGRGFQVYLVK